MVENVRRSCTEKAYDGVPKEEFSLDRFRNEYVRGTAWVEHFGGKAEMLWTCAGEGWWIYQIQDAEYGAAWQEEKRRDSDELCGCSEGGNAEERWDRAEADDVLWQPIVSSKKKKSGRAKSFFMAQ